ncbi:MAG TPA: hypothetical protein VK846_05455 [Candidatus Limnocylindria bacterium]|nr:hypothetical protein [Candidatus Limnocylindria bacterium]
MSARILVIASLFISLAARSATFNVVNTNDTGAGSLRQAILDNNATVGGTNLIQFNIPDAGVQTITPLSNLPAITTAVLIDGYTQPGASANTLTNGNNALLRIRLDGSVFAFSVGLVIRAPSVIRGLVVVNFQTYGILLNLGNGSVVEGCFVGIDADGSSVQTNGSGIQIVGATTACRIGGNTPEARNVISGSKYDGLWISQGQGHRVQGNYIGTDATGMFARGNGGSGILVTLSHFNIIGGTNVLERNVISGNGNAPPGAPLSHRDGIAMLQCNSNYVFGNYIGVNAAGTAAIGNANGVMIQTGIGNFIGSAAPGSGNLLSGNASSGMLVSGPNASGNVLQGNRIGTSADGMNAIGNYYGVVLAAAADTLIGGAGAGEGNQISGNIGGVQIPCCNSTDTRLQGNLIGTDATGSGPLGNSSHGLSIFSARNTVGGANPGEGNVIAFNGGLGVAVGPASGISIRGNSIHSNGGLGIDIFGNQGVTFNDPGDGDHDGNDLQNFPVLTAAFRTLTNVVVAGTLNSHSNKLYRLDFYGNTVCDPRGFGEGKTWLGATNVMTDGSGNVAFVNYFSGAVNASFVTATATDTNGSTSEFSLCVQVNTNGIADLVLTRSISPAFRFGRDAAHLFAHGEQRRSRDRRGSVFGFLV